MKRKSTGLLNMDSTVRQVPEVAKEEVVILLMAELSTYFS